MLAIQTQDSAPLSPLIVQCIHGDQQLIGCLLTTDYEFLEARDCIGLCTLSLVCGESGFYIDMNRNMPDRRTLQLISTHEMSASCIPSTSEGLAARPAQSLQYHVPKVPAQTMGGIYGVHVPLTSQYHPHPSLQFLCTCLKIADK